MIEKVVINNANFWGDANFLAPALPPPFPQKKCPSGNIYLLPLTDKGFSRLSSRLTTFQTHQFLNQSFMLTLLLIFKVVDQEGT